MASQYINVRFLPVSLSHENLRAKFILCFSIVPCIRVFLVLTLWVLLIRGKKLLNYNLNTDSDTLKKALLTVFSEPYSSSWQSTNFSSALEEWAILSSGDI